MRKERWVKVMSMGFFAAILVAFSLLSDHAMAKEKPSKSRAGWPETFVLAGREPGIPSYTMGVAVAELVQRELRIQTRVESWTSAMPRQIAIGKGEVHVSMQAPSTTLRACTQGLPGEYPPGQDLVDAVALCGSGYYVWAGWVRPSLKIKTPADLRDKKILYTVRGAIYLGKVTKAYLGYYGVPEKAVDLRIYKSTKEISESMRERRVDAFFYLLMPGSPFIQDLLTTKDAEFLYLKPEAISFVDKKLAWGPLGIVPAGTYPQLKEDYYGVAVPMIVLLHQGLPDSFVYEVSKSIFENLDELIKIQRNFKNLRLPESIDPKFQIVPIHPGAIQYYKEKGYWTREHEEKNQRIIAEMKEIRDRRKK